MKKKILISIVVMVGLLGALAIGLGIYFYTWYDRLIDDQPTVVVPEVTQAEINMVNEKIDTIDKSLRRGEVTRAEFSVDEINTAINHGAHFTALRNLVIVKRIAGDLVTVEASVPLEQAEGKQKYLNCEADLRASIHNGQFSLQVNEARSVNGDPLPDRVVRELESRAYAMVLEDPYAQREIERIELLEFIDGTMNIIIKP